ncbi:bifunctional ADP-dependent NAD(P)H-hydrate dehydratase/NAD(P)H-hydrate epimerase [Paenibacillus sp. AD87]|uniref:bifunctional ADP-dependent NAD(P)H-hydrate dehydratase/NAD(P)H-hydrate epimerase n=1 Tax=Paenibacillus sp. AD87 TaxID=1528787 RepID=UPI0007E4D14F|nr:bifunctional ADP-dependent NAD(P)H-hydrate dehydratase/NAD(P)H-hydrate epimerase [Paenibacillus sp. AD87]OAX45296.1 Bifunctional NAD(P)H-hydrate repair enzyme Nnr [Paenibacillus sp. AD87]
MFIVTAEQMRAVDEHTIHKLGIPAASLMENAGRAIAEEVIRLCGREDVGLSSEQQGRLDKNGKRAHTGPGDRPVHGGDIIADPALVMEQPGDQQWYMLIGKGNNGGDGLVAARHLVEAGLGVTLVYADAPDALRGEAAVQRDAAAQLGIPALVHGREAVDFGRCTGIVDALLGTGSRGAPRGSYAANDSGKPVVSADVPSGLNADTGEVYEPCIQARVTVCLALLKRGLVQYPGASTAGRIVVRSIGIPTRLAPEHGPLVRLLTEEVLRSALRVDTGRLRAPDGHKGTYGHVLLAAGSLPMSGAGLLSAKAALRAGCGLATWALPAALLPHVIGTVPELMLAAAADGDSGEWNAVSADAVLRLAESRDVLATGPGLGRFKGDTDWLRRLWQHSDRPLVIDADALNMLADAGPTGPRDWGKRSAATILTPHPGEMGRLLGMSTPEVQRDRIGHAVRYAREQGVTLVLKGARTVIATPSGEAYINTTGHAGMATGGAGDVLTGIIAGLLAQGLSAEQAATFGVFLHGQAGERAALLRGDPASLLAGDIVDAL